ncbi:hypothetical protein [Halapricum hydrolyticum]|uniref:Uncharacterized protein n=1 Tax=Halapricum hydrolyticum TaxID=2979991 RepID=A0AAE3ICA9_9EURY|nr:hypothetical protein [Halapricum hydrolyticum]MCU4718902.1 hypothetical protein [Halapricum hydrolyticum]MCU4728005.1 hypothetical protein [Halapricum hydrolyticum]
MAIPDDIQDKLDSDPSWVVQHEDIVRVMDEEKKEKPWSRYMIQQHLEGDPAKKTVNDRLDELVELDVLDEYNYNNVTLYDLAYNPIVTDGGRLRNANILDLITFRDRSGIRDLISGALFLGLAFFIFGALAEGAGVSVDVSLSDNFYISIGFMMYAVAIGLLMLLGTVRRLEAAVNYWESS